MHWLGHTGVPGVAPERTQRPIGASTHLGHATPRRKTVPDGKLIGRRTQAAAGARRVALLGLRARGDEASGLKAVEQHSHGARSPTAFRARRKRPGDSIYSESGSLVTRVPGNRRHRGDSCRRELPGARRVCAGYASWVYRSGRSHLTGRGCASLSLVAAALVLLLVLAPVGHASFPGRNGVLAFDDGVGSPPPQGGGCDDNPMSCPDAGFGQPSVFTTTNRGGHAHKLDVCQSGRLCSGASNPTWSADGTRLAARTDKGIVICDRAGHWSRVLAYPTSGPWFSGPRWSPDGRRLTATEGKNARDVRLDIIDASTGRVRHLPVRGAQTPSWSSTGWIAYSHIDDSTAKTNLWLIRPSGHGLRHLTHAGGDSPDWSPHGTRLVYTSPGGTRDHFSDVFALDLRTRRRDRLTHTGGELPVWSPDGHYIAFDRHSCIDCGGEIAVMTGQGTHSRTLLLDVNATTPSWRPQPRK